MLLSLLFFYCGTLKKKKKTREDICIQPVQTWKTSNACHLSFPGLNSKVPKPVRTFAPRPGLPQASKGLTIDNPQGPKIKINLTAVGFEPTPFRTRA